MGQYVLHTGGHIGDSPDGKNKNHVYKQGDVVTDDKIDLAATYPEKFSYPGMAPGGPVLETEDQISAQIEALTARLERKKAEAARKDEGATALDKDSLAAIDKMNVDQLRAFAEEEDVDLSDFKPTHPRSKPQTQSELAAFIKKRLGAGDGKVAQGGDEDATQGDPDAE